jgi:SAM-dependent methyltransferase
MSTKSLSFNKDAELYDEIRPGYPAKLYSELRRKAELDSNSHILEVGCGTGQATRDLIIITEHITAIDPGNNSIRVAEKHFPKLKFEIATFEGFKTTDAFDLIVSATAWHWVDPEVGYKKAHDLLKDNGYLAILHNYHLDEDPESFSIRANHIYEKYNINSKPPKQYTNKPILKMIDQLNNDYFRFVDKVEVKWQRTLSIDDYIKLRNTYSDHITMDKTKRLEFEKALRDFANKYFDGMVTKSHTAVLFLAKKKVFRLVDATIH